MRLLSVQDTERGTVMSTATVDLETLSAQCAVGQRSGYEDLHSACRQTRDVPLPHSTGILLVRRCTCECHFQSGAS